MSLSPAIYLTIPLKLYYETLIETYIFGVNQNILRFITCYI